MMLPTVEEYRGEVKRMQRNAVRFLVSAAVPAVSAPLIVVLQNSFQLWDKRAEEWLGWLMLFLGATAFVLFLVGLTRFERAIKQRTVLHCVHCGGALHGDGTKEIVIASRHCPSCGRQVLRAADNDSPKL